MNGTRTNGEWTENRYLDLAQTAIRLGVSVATVRRLIKSDGLPAIKIGRQIRIPVNDFEVWCQSKELTDRQIQDTSTHEDA